MFRHPFSLWDQTTKAKRKMQGLLTYLQKINTVSLKNSMGRRFSNSAPLVGHLFWWHGRHNPELDGDRVDAGLEFCGILPPGESRRSLFASILLESFGATF